MTLVSIQCVILKMTRPPVTARARDIQEDANLQAALYDPEAIR